MVDLHRKIPQATVVKGGRARSRTTPPKQHCVVCGCELRGDHQLGDLVCDCHPRDGYNPRHDAKLDERILVLLWRAQGAPLNLYRALGAAPIKTNRDAVQDAVARLNRSGFIRVSGVFGCGFKLAATRSRKVIKLGT